MESVSLLDRAGRRRSPATTSSFHRGVSPRNKGFQYPPDPPTVEEIIAVMRAAGDGPDGVRLRAVIVVLWRAGLRISEALALNETDLDRDRGALLVHHGKGDKRREVGMDRWCGLTSSRGSSCAAPCRSDGALIWAIVAVTATNETRSRVFLIFAGSWVGWLSATIARAGYPPPKKRLFKGDTADTT